MDNGHRIRKTMWEQHACCQMPISFEIGKPHIGSPKPGKRGRETAEKAKVAVAAELRCDKPGIAAMQRATAVRGLTIPTMFEIGNLKLV